jgi:DNA-binding transcriptional LysR family regulator
MQMRRLEETVGQRLFTKKGRRNELTSAGKELREYAQRIVRLNDEALGRFDPRSFEGRLRIGTPDDYAEAFLPQVFGRFASVHPTVEISIACRSSLEIAALVRSGELDIGVVTLEAGIGHVEAVHTEPLTWTAPPDKRLELERPLPLAVWQPGCVWRKLTLEALDAAETSYRIAYTGWNGVALTATIRAGLAVAALPHRFMGRGLRVVPPEAGLPQLGAFDIGIIKSDRGPTQLIDAFAQNVAAAFEALQAAGPAGALAAA